jgi:hypothetical protein
MMVQFGSVNRDGLHVQFSRMAGCGSAEYSAQLLKLLDS